MVSPPLYVVTLLFLIVSLLYSVSAVDAQCVNCRYGECQRNGTVNCLYGCIEGWARSDCSVKCTIDRCIDCYLTDSREEECSRCEGGRYGTRCTRRCSSNCYGGDKLCDSNGRCIHGCVSGWQGDRCDEIICTFDNCRLCDTTWNGAIYCKACVAGYYSTGEECKPCSPTCVGGSSECDTEDGFCPNGCIGNWFGDRCDRQCFLDQCEQCEAYFNKVLCRKCSPGYYPTHSKEVCNLCIGHCVGNCSGINGYCTKGCQKGWFSNKCDKECTISNCEICNLTDFNNIICGQCNKGYYWGNSQCLNCSESCLGGREMCDRSSGRCLHGCVLGQYGPRCEYPCSTHCVNNTCNATYGYCTCEEGWYGERCDRPCPVHCMCEGYHDSTCNTCEPGFFGPLCQEKCSESCQRNEFSGYLYCDKLSGHCLDGCQGGYFGTFCNHTCSRYCNVEVCEQLTGNCKFGCSFHRYGEQCQFRCSDNCNDPSPGSTVCNTATGICLFGCIPGYYGYFCNLSCPENCKDKKCDFNTGLCTNGCETGFHGPNCTIVCPENCLDNSCFSDTNGNCRRGCKSGFHGWKCDQPCSGNCAASECKQRTAECSLGCVSGFYGKMCSEVCSDRCSNNTCYQSSGLCLGCKEGFYGEDCGQECELGFYGPDCKHKCGQCINNQPCSRTDGSCSDCEVGWKGATCSEALPRSAYSHGAEVNTIAISSGVVGGVVLLCVVGVILFVMYRRRKQQRKPTASHDFIVTYVRNPTSHLKPVDSDGNPEQDESNGIYI